MAKPKAYEPVQGQMYQILVRMTPSGPWEHCDYAKDKAEKDSLAAEYASAYRYQAWFQSIKLPKKYWPVKEVNVCKL